MYNFFSPLRYARGYRQIFDIDKFELEYFDIKETRIHL